MGDLYNPFPKLPKNIRQIGDPDQVVRLYLEDYVYTYLKRLYPMGKQTLRVGLLLGSVEQNDGTPYIFIDGALEMEDIEIDGERLIFSENSWKKAYLEMEKAFPKRNIQGWFLCGGQGSQLSPLNYWKQHGQYFTGKNQLMYLNHGLEGEESIYITSENGFYKLKGHCIYYERNQMMQDYMVTRKDARRVESGVQENVIRDFRERMIEKKELAERKRHTVGALGMACGILSVAVLAGGVALVNNYNKMQQMESVLTSVLPAGVGTWEDFVKKQAEEPDFIIEELPGNVHPIETAGTMSGIAETYSSGAENKNIVDADSDEIEEAIPYESGAYATGLYEAGQTGGSGEDNTGTSGTTENADTSGNSGESEETWLSVPLDYEAAAASGYRIYEISEGETLYGICWNVYGDLRNLTEICILNNLDDVDHIIAGQKLILP